MPHSEKLTDFVLKEASIFSPLANFFESRENKKALKRIDSHFRTDDKSKWDSFLRNTGRKSFVKNLSRDPRSDEKLVMHADNMNRMRSGKKLGTVSGSTGKRYDIVKLRGSPRLGCNCNDWRYKRSVALASSPDSEKDCRHIKQWKREKQTKVAGMSFLKQDRPEKVKDIYKALKRDHPTMPAEMKARIAARQGKPGKQKQGPPYKGPIKSASIPLSFFNALSEILSP